MTFPKSPQNRFGDIIYQSLNTMDEGITVLSYWRPHEQFQRWLEEKLLSFLPALELQIRFYADILEKVYLLNLDRLLPLAMSRYSFTGRLAK